MNSRLKEGLAVNSRTLLPTLFEALRWASSTDDWMAVQAIYVEEAAAQPMPCTVSEHTQGKVSRFAREQIAVQWSLQHNYELKQSIGEGNATVWVAVHRGNSERKHTMTVTATSMQCSCSYPAMYQLPCRHVLCLNQRLHNKPFLPTQLGQRWLLHYMPPDEYDAQLVASVHSVPSFPPSLTSMTQADRASTYTSRYGTLYGLCKYIVCRAAEYVDAYPGALERVQQLKDWVTQQTSELAGANSAATSIASVVAASSTSASSANPAPVLSTLNANVPISEMREPPKPKRKQGRSQEGRFPSRGERGTKRGKEWSQGQRAHVSDTARLIYVCRCSRK